MGNQLDKKYIDKINNLFCYKMPVELYDVTIYPRSGDFKSNIKRSGTYYLWDDNIVNGKIRITTAKENIEKYGCIIGWVNVTDIIKNDDISIGDAVFVNGVITEYADGNGSTISKLNTLMYVVDIMSEEFEYNYALASSPNRARQGWAKKEMLEKA